MPKTHTLVRNPNIYKNILECGWVEPQAHVKNAGLNSSSKKIAIISICNSTKGKTYIWGSNAKLGRKKTPTPQKNPTLDRGALTTFS